MYHVIFYLIVSCDYWISLPLRTCFYALCLVAKTKRGVEELKQLGWVSVCHSHEHKWPVVNKKGSSTPSTTLQRNTSTTTSTSTTLQSVNARDSRCAVQHQSSLPTIVLTSTDCPEVAAARRRALLKKCTSTMGTAHHQKILEDKVSDFVSDSRNSHIANSSPMEQAPKMRSGNVSSQKRPVSMMSL